MRRLKHVIMINVGFDFSSFRQKWRACEWHKNVLLRKGEFLEQEGDLNILKELHLKMCELAESTDVYTVKWLKNKLKEKYEEHIFFAEIKGSANVVF